MSAAAITALAVTAVLVAALAFYLLWVLSILHRLIQTLGKVLFGVGAIGHRLEPVGPVLHDINAGLDGVADAMDRLAADLDRQSRAAS
jgi:hypothetical protein